MMHAKNRRPCPYAVLLAALAASGAGCATQDDDRSKPDGELVVVREFPIDSIALVRDLTLDEGGNLWIISSSPPFISVVDSVGKIISAKGSRGHGPTDFLYPLQFVPAIGAESGRPAVLDLGRNALLALDAEQTPSKATAVRAVGGSMRSDITRLIGRLPFAVNRAPNEALAVVIDRNVSSARDLAWQSVLRFHDGSTDTVWRNTTLPVSRTKWLVSYPLWTSCGKDGLKGVNAEGTKLLHVSFGGRVDSIQLPKLVERKLIDADAQEIQLRNQIENEYLDRGTSVTAVALRKDVAVAMSRASKNDYDSLPAFASVKCASDGAVWLQSFDPSDSPLGLGRIWWRIQDSSHTTYKMPPKFQPMSISKLNAIGIRADSVENLTVGYVSLRR